MATPLLVRGTLYINRDRDFRSGIWGPYVKIGIVRNERDAKARNKEHQTGNPREIVTRAEFQSPMVEHLETQLHHRFATRWVHGEWFEMDGRFVEQVLIPQVEDLIGDQRSFFDDFEHHQHLRQRASSGVARPASAEERETWRQAVDVDGQLKRAKGVRDLWDARLRAAVGDAAGIPGAVTLVTKSIAPRFDEKAFAATHPVLAEAYTEDGELAVTGRLRLQGCLSLAKIDAAAAAEIKAAQQMATKFEAGQDRGITRPLCSEVKMLHAGYVESLADVAKADWRLECLKARLARMLGGDAGIEGVISWERVEVSKPKFDVKRFQQDHADLFRKFQTPPREDVSVIIHPHRAYALS